MSREHPTVLVVDDQELFRSGIIRLLEQRSIRVVGEAGLAADAIKRASELHPDVVLMDLNMPGMSGVEATQRLKTAAPAVRVLVLTVAADERHVMDALLAGAYGYMLKEAPIAQLVEAVKAAARGESAISPRVASGLVQRLREPSQHAVDLSGAPLTPREHEVLELLACGMDNPEIARALYLSEHTVKNYVSSILDKLQVENRVQAAVRAVRAGIV
jgi:two-component system, NarL family, nitrate/nitrite response regulator NarL